MNDSRLQFLKCFQNTLRIEIRSKNSREIYYDPRLLRATQSYLREKRNTPGTGARYLGRLATTFTNR